MALIIRNTLYVWLAVRADRSQCHLGNLGEIRHCPLEEFSTYILYIYITFNIVFFFQSFGISYALFGMTLWSGSQREHSKHPSCSLRGDPNATRQKNWPNNPHLLLPHVVFWDKTPCGLVEVNWRFVGTYCLHLQVQILSGKQPSSTSPSCSLVASLYPEDRGSMLPGNVG
jgi:hypothetical protein